MLTRRVFAACALCAAGGFWAGAVEAQTTQTPGLTRTLLKQSDGPVAGYVTVEMRIDIEPAGAPGSSRTRDRSNCCVRSRIGSSKRPIRDQASA